MKTKVLLLATAIFIIASCKTTKQTITHTTSTKVEEKKLPEPRNYRASNARLSDILHQELRVSFDWDKKYMFGQSTLTIKPYFYSTDSLYLDARGMEIKEVSLLSGENKKPLNYKYENDSLKIKLDKTYSSNEEYKIFIDYVAKPDELKDVGGSAAISSDKGLYFINPDGKEKDKPKQIWTQGETQSNSVWFPTIDSPNERMTQEIYITVDTSFVTLSNGLLISSIVNAREGTRTDYWKQMIPAAPYLTMMAISNFKIVKDKWRDKEVNYYVDAEYEKNAKMIFGNTPEMIEFFSKKLGVDFAWEKYSQVVVHDYVSGAMENASATLHGEFLQRDDRAYLDGTNEDIISHELFHQWFGDLVTCESWSNIPLNESFATYGEYLWNENKYGREAADYGLMNDLSQYLSSASRRNNPDLVRYYYENREELFDGITYQKGGRILHMLRKFVGDDAFFKSLNFYLITNKFKPVEIHNLRLAFEEVTGQDLNWFFNQWFFNHGHPDLNISYTWNDSLKTEFVIVEQKQDFEKDSLFSLPFAVDVYTNGKAKRYNAWITHMKDTLTYKAESKPELVNVDAEKMLVCTKKDNHTTAEWIYQYNHAPLFLDRYEAVQKLGKNYDAEAESGKVMMSALNDKFWNIRTLAIKNIGKLAEAKKEEVKKALIDLAKNDPKAAVREAALNSLSKNFTDSDLTALYESAVHDLSYNVMEKALKNLVDKDKEKGLAIAKNLEPENNKHIKNIIAGVYADYGSDENLNFVSNALNESSGEEKYEATLNYGKLLIHCKPATIEKGISDLEDVAKRGNPWWVKLAGIQALSELSKSCKDKHGELAKISTEATNADKYKQLGETIEKDMKAIKEAETDKNLKRIYGRAGTDIGE